MTTPPQHALFFILGQAGREANAPLDEVRKHYGGQRLISGNQSLIKWGRANGAK